MAFVTLIVRQEFLSVPTRGTIQYHPSLLPRHRGRSAINWPVIKGETETGLTVFWPDGGIDTGDVLLQRTTPISETDTLGSVYFDRLFPMGVEALLEAVDLVAAGAAPRIPQDEALATYEAPCEQGQRSASTGASRAARSTTSSAAATRSPAAWTTRGGQALQIFAATPQPARDVAGVGGAMGEVAAVGDEGFSVVCADGRLLRDPRAAGRRRQAGAPASGPLRAASSPAPASSSRRRGARELVAPRSTRRRRPPQLGQDSATESGLARSGRRGRRCSPLRGASRGRAYATRGRGAACLWGRGARS